MTLPVPSSPARRPPALSELHQLACRPCLQRPFPFMTSGMRRGSTFWWAYWFNPRSYWDALLTFWHRARYGYAPQDLSQLDEYLATWMPAALHRMAVILAPTRTHCPTTELEHALPRIHAGWESAWHLLEHCDCLDSAWRAIPQRKEAPPGSEFMPDTTSSAYLHYCRLLDTHERVHRANWHEGLALFQTYYFHLWI